MTIDSIHPIDHVPRGSRATKGNQKAENTSQDSVRFSGEAKNRAEFEAATQHTHNIPDIRVDVVAKAKEKINDPNYLNNKSVTDTVADRIIDMLEI